MTQAGPAVEQTTGDTASGIHPWRVIAWLGLGLPALLLVLASIGALQQVVIEGLPQEPPATLVLLPIVRLARDIAATLAIGLLLVGGLLAPRPDPRLLRAASIAALAWLLSVLAFVVLTVSELLAFSIDDSLQPVVIASFISQTNLGQLLVLQLVCALLVAILGWAVVNRVTGVIALVIALVGACATALTGHSGLHSGHESASISLALHIAAVALWVGGLAGAVLLSARDRSAAPSVLRRFSAIALVCVIVVGESGLLNASLRLGAIAPLLTTTYGVILLAKTAALAWLVRLGWLQRRRVVAAVSNAGWSNTLLARYAAAEFAIMGVALGLAVALARTAAPTGSLPAAPIAMGAAAAIAVGLGSLLAVLAARTRIASGIRSLPEAWAVAFLVVLALTAGGTWLPELVGVTPAALLGCALLLLAGTAMAVAAATPRGWPAAALAIAGWLALTALTSNAQDASRWLATLVGCAGIAVIALRARRRATQTTSVPEEAAV